MTLLAVHGENFCGFQEFYQPLKNRGLVWLGGDNRDTKAAGSNGAGKTGFFKAISWGLFGETIDGADGDAVIREGQKSAIVNIDLEGHYNVTRTRRKGTPRLALSHNGEPVPGGKDEIQAHINRLVGMDFHTFRNVVLYGQRDLQRFLAPGTKDADRKEVLQAILRTQVYSAALEWVKRSHLEMKNRLEKLCTDIDQSKARIEEYDLEEMNLQALAWMRKNAEAATTMKNSARDALREAKRLLEETPDIAAMEARLAKLRKRQDEQTGAKAGLVVALAKQKAEAEVTSSLRENVRNSNLQIQALEKSIKTLESGTCPVCTSDVGSGYASVHFRSLKKRLEESHVYLRINDVLLFNQENIDKELALASKKRQQELDAFDGVAEEISDLRLEIETAKGTKERAASAKEKAKDFLERAKNQLLIENPFQIRLNAAKERLRVLQKQVKINTASAEALDRDRAHYEFWARGFGPSGIVSFVLDSVMPYMTERTNYYLDTLSDGDITMNFTTQTELKSSKGDIRDKIGVFWECEGTSQKPLSGGQFKKCEVATTFAMMDLVATREGANMDLLLIDEALDGLDEEGGSRVMDLLHKLRTQRHSIFCVSHDKDVGEIFERALVVVKENGISRLESAA